MIEATLPKGKLSILKGPYPQLGLTGPFACTVQASQCQCCSCRDATGAASQSLQTLLSEGAMQESEGPAEGCTCEAANCPTVVLYTVCPAEGRTVQASASATYSKAGIERCCRILGRREVRPANGSCGGAVMPELCATHRRLPARWGWSSLRGARRAQTQHSIPAAGKERCD